MNKRGFTLIELLVVIVIIGILVAIALPNFIRIKDKAKEAEVKQNCHAIQLALERYAVDSPTGNYPFICMGGDWTDTRVVWQSWVDMQENLDPDMITNPDRRDGWEAADYDVGDSLVMESYLPSYPNNPFLKNKTDTLLPMIYHYPEDMAYSNLCDPFWRIVGGRESDKMYECFGPGWWIAPTSCVGDFYVHHIYNNPPYDYEGDIYKDPQNAGGDWTSPSGNRWLVGNFSYWPRADEKGSPFPYTGASDPMGYTLAAYGAIRTHGQDVYNRNGNYKGRFRTENCDIDCRGGSFDDIPCICDTGLPPSAARNNGGSDTLPDGVVMTLDSGVDKKSAKVNVNFTESD